MDSNLYLRRPYSLAHEEIAFHKRNPETGIILGAEPFFIKGGVSEAILCIHGYTSTPRDLRVIGEQLAGQGFTVSGVLLPGHGTRPTSLDSVHWEEWYHAVRSEYLKLRQICKTVHVIGFSMGGSLAMHLAANETIGKIVLLSPFFKIAYLKHHLIPQEWLVYTVGKLLRHLKKRHSGNCNDVSAQRSHIAYYHYALSSIQQALELVRVIQRESVRISNPVLIIHSKNDKTTRYSASRGIYNVLPSHIKRFVTLTRSNHIIPHDLEKERVFGEISRFLCN